MEVGTAVASLPKPIVTLCACLSHPFPPTLPLRAIKCVSIPGMHTGTLSFPGQQFGDL